MLFRQYDNIEAFNADVLDILLEHEVQNNLLISLITNDSAQHAKDWFLAAVTSDGGGIALTAICTKPFDLILFETGNISSGDAVDLLVNEMRRVNFNPPGVMAAPGLARRFSDYYAGTGAGRLHMTSSIMRLDKLAEHKAAPGALRALEKRDMFFAPYWERAFSEDCRTPVFSIPEYTRRLTGRLGKDTHFIWEDGVPVSQAVHGRDTPNGAVINGVYTPPHYRGRGYAKSAVAGLSKSLLDRGVPFCCLFADSDNQVSCGLYKSLGYYEVCSLDNIRFDRQP